MAIVYEGYGNVLNHPAQTITCPVNVVGAMGAGLALAMRNRIRGLNQHYKFLCEEGLIGIGKCAIFEIPDQEKQVLLFPTKAHWKDPSELEYIEEGLKDLAKRIDELKIDQLAIPAIGCGYGKLDYLKDVRPLIFKYLDPIDTDVYLLLREHK